MTKRAAFLDDRGVVRVSGEDAAGFLQGLLTNDVARLGPQHSIDVFHLLFVQPTGTARSFSFRQASQSLPVEAVNPILHRTRRVT